jgi:hypothetical protein
MGTRQRDKTLSAQGSKTDIAEVGICLIDIADGAGAHGYAPL